jgi:TRAP-type C4-dicarboxylate transport system substrate-binding protein
MYLGRTTGAAIAALSTVLMTSLAPVAAADFVLRFATINAAETASYAKVLEPFARAVEQESGGRIEVALKPIGGYGKPADLFNMVEKGDIEIAATVQGYNPGRFPQSSVMELPLMYENSIAGTEAMWSLYKEGLLDKDYASVKVLGLYVLPPYGIFTTGKKIAALKDLRGMRMRTPSPTVGLALAKLGAIPIGVPVNLVGEAIANGTLDAIAYGWDSATTTKGAGDKMLIEQVSVLVDANFAAPALMVVMNRAKWDALPPDLQAILDKHSPDFVGGNARIRETMEAATKKKLQADPRYTYVGLSAEQRADMQRIITPAVTDWKASMAKLGIDGEKLLARAQELIQQFKVAAK